MTLDPDSEARTAGDAVAAYELLTMNSFER